jgi:hypothetical protein
MVPPEKYPKEIFVTADSSIAGLCGSYYKIGNNIATTDWVPSPARSNQNMVYIVLITTS